MTSESLPEQVRLARYDRWRMLLTMQILGAGVTVATALLIIGPALAR